jgi:L-2-hydroxyglutarate oxidase LhgO|tara:strand:+ start:716 stop:1831 length:1116 start_codon:yes stop_codon:yes gene_type:complete
MKDRVHSEILVVGGGIIGLSIARDLQNNFQAIVIDKNNELGEEVSSRNSGVVHSGIYYPKNSLKAKLCINGNKILHQYAAKKNIKIIKAGKLIVGSKIDEKKILALYRNGINNEVSNLSLIDKEEIKQLEPNISEDIKFGILSKSSSVIDASSLLHSIADDFQEKGGIISKQTTFIGHRLENKNHIVSVVTNGELFEIEAKILIMATGLHSFENGQKIENVRESNKFKKLNFTKGHYFYVNKPPFKRLIYPLPNDYGLGIHFTPDFGGRGKFGPDTHFTELIDYKFESKIKNKFIQSISRYWEGVSESVLHEDYVGIRPKIQASHEKNIDFSILTPKDHGLENLYFLQGIESPGLTSSLAIGNLISQLVLK